MKQQNLRIVNPELKATPKKEERTKALVQTDFFPELRYMGSKRRLLPWIHEILSTLDFETALDPFSGSNAVAYLIKAMDRRAIAGSAPAECRMTP